MRPPSALLRSYHAGPSRFGTYPALQASTALTIYPLPLPVPRSIARPPYVPSDFFGRTTGLESREYTDEKSGEERIGLGGDDEKAVRRIARVAAEILQEVGRLVKPGTTTSELDRAVHRMIVDRGAYPSTLGYSKFPKSCTTSVNNVIAHGIPDDRPLHPEDSINVDLTLYLNSYHGDTSATFMLPEVDKQGRDLVEATREALELGVQICRPGQRFNEIGRVIEEFAKRHGFSVNSQLSGHGIGRDFHREPWILHHKNSEAGTMTPGDCFTIEPILVQGSNSRGKLWDDGWTVATENNARAAQFEHQILITEDGADVLTLIN